MNKRLNEDAICVCFRAYIARYYLAVPTTVERIGYDTRYCITSCQFTREASL